jgi:NADH dehydrogenase
MLASFMKKTPIFSYFGKGDYLMQPVSVFEVAEIFIKACENKDVINKEFSICGSKKLTYKELLKLIIKLKEWNKLLVSVPEFIIKISISVCGNFNWFPLTKDQFQMLLEGNICQDREIFDILAIESLDIEKVLKRYL